MALTTEDAELLEQVRRREDLDRVSTTHRVVIAVCTGASAFSSLPLRMIGAFTSRAVTDPPGGQRTRLLPELRHRVNTTPITSPS
jgi:hypothetical protein